MENIKKNGWNMLDSYKEGQIIYGRDEEIASISENIQYNVQTFLYGKSGIGKTSLIQAGVFPELRKAHYFPIIIRLALYDKKETLNSIVKRLVIEEAEKSNIEIGKCPLTHDVIDCSDVSEAPLYEFFSKVRFEDKTHHPYIPVLIFDQFEETINNEDFWQRTVDFIKDDLYDLMDNSNVVHSEALPYTNYRIVISMREDYLYCLEDIIDQFSLWELRYNRFRIKALDDDKAAEVIHKTSGLAGLESGNEDKIVNTIIKIVKLSSGTRFTEINTALLSLICSLLYDNSEDECIRYKDLRNINMYLRSYYDDICNKIGSKATHYLEEHLLTKDGRRSSMDESEAINSGKISQKSLNYLVEQRLLRRIKADNTSNRYEYIHDLFAKMVYKRLQEDKAQWFYPELRTLSKKEDRTSFLRKFTLTLCAVIIICCTVLFIHSELSHGTWIFWNFSKCFENNLLNFSTPYYLLFGASVYLFSLVTKRLHDVNKTGWLCFIIPISAFLININHFFPFIFSEKLYAIAMGLGCLLLSYLTYLCFKTSVKNNTKSRGFSRKYEKIISLASINNVEFAKSFSIELIWWTICCCMVDMFFSSYFPSKWYGYDLWRVFHIETRLIFFAGWLTISLPPVISLLPLIISFSPTLRARVRSFGYPIWISFIPYFNLLLLVEGFLPNNFLMKLKLIKNKRNREKFDNIFAEINDDFTIYEDYIYINQVKSSIRKAAILSTFIPFYGIIKGINKDEKIGIRYISMRMGLCNVLIILLILFISIFSALLLWNKENWEIYFWIYSFIVFILEISCFIGLYLTNVMKKKIIICFMNEHPTYSINQIAHELALKPSDLEKITNKMKLQGTLLRVEKDGKLMWEIVKK